MKLNFQLANCTSYLRDQLEKVRCIWLFVIAHTLLDDGIKRLLEFLNVVEL